VIQADARPGPCYHCRRDRLRERRCRRCSDAIRPV